MTTAVVIGGGPAGLMAAEQLLQAGTSVDLYDAMPSLGRKFLLAGIGGLNITHAEDWSSFLSRYPHAPNQLVSALNQFSSAEFVDWVHALGVETFIGSSGRVFPREMKAAPLLRRWLQRSRDLGLRTHVRHRLTAWQAMADGQFALTFETPEGVIKHHAQCVVMALGGASWAKLGSDGRWLAGYEQAGIRCQPLLASNCGFEVAWSDFMLTHAGAPLKNISIQLPWLVSGARLGEAVLTQHGLEGSLVYALSAAIRQQLQSQGQATILLDLCPATSAEAVMVALTKPAKGKTMSQRLRALGLDAAKIALVHEAVKQSVHARQVSYAELVKALPVTLLAARPIDEAISCAGGVDFSEITAQFMVQRYPGLFCAGEMLDWDAPTGGYLLTACMATGRQAGMAAAEFCITNQGVNDD